MISQRVKDIDVNNYENKVFLTFDIDWATDEVLNHNLDLLEDRNLKGTFFVTHKTPVLERIRENENLELGIHPNFNFLLSGDHRYGKTFQKVIDYYLEMVPDAVSVRSHCLVQSSPILSYFKSLGLKQDLNLYLPKNSGIEAKPFEDWNFGLTRMPHFWEDDLHITYKDDWNTENYLNSPGLKIFDFHPIHLFLNTEKLEQYNSCRGIFQDFEILQKKVNKSTYGTKDFFVDLTSNLE